jgi:hypothetical protein
MERLRFWAESRAVAGVTTTRKVNCYKASLDQLPNQEDSELPIDSLPAVHFQLVLYLPLYTSIEPKFQFLHLPRFKVPLQVNSILCHSIIFASPCISSGDRVGASCWREGCISLGESGRRKKGGFLFSSRRSSKAIAHELDGARGNVGDDQRGVW